MHDAMANVPACINIHTSPKRVWKEKILRVIPGMKTLLSGCYMAGANLTAAISAQVLCTPHSHAPNYRVILFEATYVGYRCLAITYYLFFVCFQTDQDILHALW